MSNIEFTEEQSLEVMNRGLRSGSGQPQNILIRWGLVTSILLFILSAVIIFLALNKSDIPPEALINPEYGLPEINRYAN